MKQPKDNRSLCGFGRNEEVDGNAFDDHQESNHSKDGSDVSILVIRKNPETRGFSSNPIINTNAKQVCPDELFVHKRSEWLLDHLEVEDRIVHFASFRTAFVRRLPRFESRKIRIPSALVNTVLLPKTSTCFRARVTAV